MYRLMPMWYSKQVPTFSEISEQSRIEVIRVPSTATTPPCLKLSQRIFTNDALVTDKIKMQYIRLSLPIKCNSVFVQK